MAGITMIITGMAFIAFFDMLEVGALLMILGFIVMGMEQKKRY